MTNEPGFTPVFGPNGAVLNSPSMTPRMREEIQRSARPLTRKRMFEAAALAALGVLFVALFPNLLELFRASPWWAGAFTGVVATLALGVLWRSVVARLRRWELIGPSARDRNLRLPFAARWSLALLDCFAVASYIAYFVLVTADLNQQLGVWRNYAGFAMLAAGIAALMGLAFRLLADRLGWTWRAAAA
jgi:hypothetical protein